MEIIKGNHRFVKAFIFVTLFVSHLFLFPTTLGIQISYLLLVILFGIRVLSIITTSNQLRNNTLVSYRAFRFPWAITLAVLLMQGAFYQAMQSQASHWSAVPELLSRFITFSPVLFYSLWLILSYTYQNRYFFSEEGIFDGPGLKVRYPWKRFKDYRFHEAKHQVVLIKKGFGEMHLKLSKSEFESKQQQLSDFLDRKIIQK